MSYFLFYFGSILSCAPYIEFNFLCLVVPGLFPLCFTPVFLWSVYLLSPLPVYRVLPVSESSHFRRGGVSQLRVSYGLLAVKLRFELICFFFVWVLILPATQLNLKAMCLRVSNVLCQYFLLHQYCICTVSGYIFYPKGIPLVRSPQAFGILASRLVREKTDHLHEQEVTTNSKLLHWKLPLLFC